MNSLRAVIRAGSFALFVLVLGIAAHASEWQRGDVSAAIGNGQYQVYRQTVNGKFTTYSLIETLTDGSGTVSGEHGSGGNGYTTGCAFDSTSHLYTTNFSNTKVYKFSIPDPHSVSQTIDTNAAAPGGHSESLVFDGSGNFFVGNPDFHPNVGQAVVLKYSPAGTLLNTFTVATGDRGADWLELSADGNTLYYTSEGTSIKTFNLSTNTQGSDFFTEESGALFTVRILPPSFGDFAGDFLVANTANVLRLHVSERVTVAQTYTIDGATSLFALGLDTNGTSFWVGDIGTGNLYRINVSSGAIEFGPIPTGAIPSEANPAATLGGICVDGLATAAQPQPVVQTVTLTPTSNSATVFNDNNSNSWQITLDGLTTTATATIAFTEIPQSAGNSDIPGYGPCELASADGKMCTVHQVSVDVDPSHYPGGIDFYHHWNFKPPTPINPRMIKNGTTDITTAVYPDPGTGGHTNSPSTYLDNEAPKPTGSSCGFLFPPNSITWEAEFPLTFAFTAVANGNKCSRGPFLTNLKPVISLALIGTSPTITPITLPSTSFRNFLGLGIWYYILPTKTLQPGTYLVSVFDQSNHIPLFSEHINIVPDK